MMPPESEYPDIQSLSKRLLPPAHSTVQTPSYAETQARKSKPKKIETADEQVNRIASDLDAEKKVEIPARQERYSRRAAEKGAIEEAGREADYSAYAEKAAEKGAAKEQREWDAANPPADKGEAKGLADKGEAKDYDPTWGSRYQEGKQASASEKAAEQERRASRVGKGKGLFGKKARTQAAEKALAEQAAKDASTADVAVSAIEDMAAEKKAAPEAPAVADAALFDMAPASTDAGGQVWKVKGDPYTYKKVGDDIEVLAGPAGQEGRIIEAGTPAHKMVMEQLETTSAGEAWTGYVKDDAPPVESDVVGPPLPEGLPEEAITGSADADVVGPPLPAGLPEEAITGSGEAKILGYTSTGEPYGITAEGEQVLGDPNLPYEERARFMRSVSERAVAGEEGEPGWDRDRADRITGDIAKVGAVGAALVGGGVVGKSLLGAPKRAVKESQLYGGKPVGWSTDPTYESPEAGELRQKQGAAGSRLAGQVQESAVAGDWRTPQALKSATAEEIESFADDMARGVIDSEDRVAMQFLKNNSESVETALTNRLGRPLTPRATGALEGAQEGAGRRLANLIEASRTAGDWRTPHAFESPTAEHIKSFVDDMLKGVVDTEDPVAMRFWRENSDAVGKALDEGRATLARAVPKPVTDPRMSAAKTALSRDVFKRLGSFPALLKTMGPKAAKAMAVWGVAHAAGPVSFAADLLAPAEVGVSTGRGTAPRPQGHGAAAASAPGASRGLLSQVWRAPEKVRNDMMTLSNMVTELGHPIGVSDIAQDSSLQDAIIGYAHASGSRESPEALRGLIDHLIRSEVITPEAAEALLPPAQ